MDRGKKTTTNRSINPSMNDDLTTNKLLNESIHQLVNNKELLPE